MLEDQRAPSPALGGEFAYAIYLPDGHGRGLAPELRVGDDGHDWAFWGRMAPKVFRLTDADRPGG